MAGMQFVTIVGKVLLHIVNHENGVIITELYINLEIAVMSF